VKIQSREVALALAAIGLLSYAACTADKADTKVGSIPPVTKVASIDPVVKQAPRMVDGVFATDEHLETVYFDLNKSKLSDSSMEIVKTNAEWLKTQPPFLVRILGYADPRGSLKKNERLAEKRANSLKDAYIALGISGERISVVTRGAEEVDCKPLTEDCLAKSRRTETLMEDKALASR